MRRRVLRAFKEAWGQAPAAAGRNSCSWATLLGTANKESEECSFPQCWFHYNFLFSTERKLVNHQYILVAVPYWNAFLYKHVELIWQIKSKYFCLTKCDSAWYRLHISHPLWKKFRCKFPMVMGSISWSVLWCSYSFCTWVAAALHEYIAMKGHI